MFDLWNRSVAPGAPCLCGGTLWAIRPPVCLCAHPSYDIWVWFSSFLSLLNLFLGFYILKNTHASHHLHQHLDIYCWSAFSGASAWKGTRGLTQNLSTSWGICEDNCTFSLGPKCSAWKNSVIFCEKRRLFFIILWAAQTLCNSDESSLSPECVRSSWRKNQSTQSASLLSSWPELLPCRHSLRGIWRHFTEAHLQISYFSIQCIPLLNIKTYGSHYLHIGCKGWSGQREKKSQVILQI